MKKFLSTSVFLRPSGAIRVGIIILVLLVSSLAPTVSIAAQPCPTGTVAEDQSGVWDVTQWFNFSDPKVVCVPKANAPTINIPGIGDTGVGVGAQTTNAINDGMKSIVGAASTALDWTAGITVSFIFNLASIIVTVITEIAIFTLMLVGLLFNFVVEQLVVNMGHFITSSSSTGIQTAWQIVRDLANIAIIGGLIATAIGTIIQSSSYNANKLLARLIIAALLVNFSYFFAGAIIDSSNFLATQFYKSTICGASDPTCANTTIAGTFQDITNIQVINSVKNLSVQATQGNLGGPAIRTFLSSVLFLVMVLVTIFVFLSAIALLVGRFVSLVFILIASPIGIAGSAIPGLDKYAKEWWGILWAQAFFAPLYFLLLGFSITILKNFTSTKAFSALDTNSAATDVGTILNFIVATVFMLLSLRFAKQLSETGKQYLGDFYKGADKLTGWMPKAYTGALKYMGSSAGTYSIGRIGNVAGRGYDKFMATRDPNGFLAKRVAGTFIDRNIKKGFEAVGNAKFGGKENYEDTLKAKEHRKTLLSEEQKFQEALKKEPDLAAKKKKAQEGRDALIGKYGDQGSGKKLEDRIAQEKFKKNFDDLTDEQKKEVMAHDDWKKEYTDLNKLAQENYKKDWHELNNAEREKLSENKKWRGRKWVQQPNGTFGWEKGFDYEDRLQKGMDYRTAADIKEDQNRQATLQFGKTYSSLSDDQKKEIDAVVADKKNWLTLQGATDDQRTAITDVSWERIKDEHLRNPDILHKVTPMLSTEQYLDAMKDKSISKKEKEEMRGIRLGKIMREAQEFEDNVVELEKWENMSEADRRGKILRGSSDYDAYRWSLHEKLKKYYNADEIVEYIESDSGISKATNIRANGIFNDAMTHGVYNKLQKSNKISSGQKRAMRSLKRTRYENAIKMDNEAAVIFEEAGITTETERDRIMREATTDPNSDTGLMLSAEEYDAELKKRGGDKTTEGKLFKAAWLRKRAETAAANYFAGKAPEEVAGEVKQESYGTRLGGKFMRRDQLRASGGKDQKWQDAQAQAMAIHGSDQELLWLKFASDGENFTVDWKAIDAERARLGLDSVATVVARSKGKTGNTITPEKNLDEEIEEVAERNAAAAGTAAPREPARTIPVQQAEARIRTVLSKAAERPASIESLEEPETEEEIEEIEEVIGEMPLNDVVRLSSDILKNPKIAGALDKRHVETLLEAGLPSKTHDVLIDNIITHTLRKDVRDWLKGEGSKYLSEEQKKKLAETN